ncbi:MAG: hypothetical protein KAJ75_02530 [Alphaproteobacteria bacterium]|nr:hypothetical protein [Alphaproteobacteria bacterium]
MNNENKETAQIKLPKIMGHQGCQDDNIKGNAKAAFVEAKRQGAEWIEIDVQSTKDNKLVLSHSYILSGISKYGKGLVCRTNLKDIQESTAKNGEKILTLDEGLAYIKELGLKVNIEIKTVPLVSSFKTVDETIKALKRQGFDDGKSAYISSFSKKAIYATKFLKPNIPRCLLDVANTPRFLKDAKKLDCFAVGFDKRFATKKLIKKAKNAGFQTVVFTSNQLEKAEELFNKGVDVIITDRPQALSNETISKNLAKTITQLKDKLR